MLGNHNLDCLSQWKSYALRYATYVTNDYTYGTFFWGGGWICYMLGAVCLFGWKNAAHRQHREYRITKYPFF